MRLVAWFSVLLCLSFGRASAAANRMILDAANVDVAPIQKLSSSRSETELGFRMAGIEAEPVDLAGSTYQTVTPVSSQPKKFGETGEDGLPNLPLFAQLVAIPDQAGVKVEIISSSYQVLDNYDVMPSQPSPLEGSTEQPPFTKDEAAYDRNEFYPSELVQLGEPIVCRDLRMIQTVVNPVQYNPVTRQLRVYTSVDYRLSYEGIDSRNVKVRRGNQISETFLPLYRALVPNADEMLASYQPVRGGYLILTPDAFADSILALARWKHLKGYSVVVTRATQINPSGAPLPAEIFDYIQDAYQNWTVPPEFVCIVGDESGLTTYFSDLPYGSYASDHEYSCVDGSDYFSDVMVTRMSVPNTMSIFRTTMWKAIKYDSDPFMGDPSLYARGLSVGGNTMGAITQRLTTLWVREQLLRHGYSQVDTAFCWNPSSYSCPSDPQIAASFTNGVGITNVRGAGGSNGWWAPAFDISGIDGLPGNNKMGVLAVLTCGTGAFATADCFGEHWIRAGSLPNALKGGPAFFGASDGSTHCKWNNPIVIGFNWAYLEEGIYNFASAAFRGKVEDYLTYPQFIGPGDWVEHYFHVYNTLGEPELEIRTAVPQSMTVTYPATIPVGSTMQTVHVVGSGGGPLVDAYVCLQKDGVPPNDEVFVGGRTDSNGDITLNFNAATAGTMNVTVTSHNYIPHRGTVSVQVQAVALNASAIALDDDNSGNSSGNNDGRSNPGETVEFAVTLHNFGNSTTATNVSATLTSSEPDVTITVPIQSYGSIAPGADANSGKFAAHLANNILHGEHIILRLNIASDQGNWSAAVAVDVKSMMFAVTGTTYPGNGNNRLDPGELSQMVISLRNDGGLTGASMTATLTTSDTAITIIDGTADFGTIDTNATGSNAASPFTVQVRQNVYQGRNVNFNLQLASSNGSIASRTFSVVIGNVSTYDALGPDSYGYYIYDNTDGTFLPAPFYNWIEVSPNAGGPGARITFPGSNTDDNAEVISLPFNLTYYGQSFSYALVSINGFIAFDTTWYDMEGHHWTAFDNGQIPEPGAPDGLIAPFWDDLEYTGDNGVFYYFDSANHRFIIEWKSCTHAREPNHHPETFEMIICDPGYYPTPTGDCEIIFQYQVVYNDDNDSYNELQPGLYSTVGMQNLRNDDGLQYTYDNLYHPAAPVLQAGRAIKITTATGMTPPPDIAYDPASFSKTAEVGQVILDTLSISNVGTGILTFALHEYADNRVLSGQGKTQANSYQASAEPIAYSLLQGTKPGDDNQPIYPPMILNAGGPDAYGNYWIDSDEPGGPSYSWVDIGGVGIPVTLGDDNFVGPIDIGFSFSFYGTDYSSIYINSNGFLSFGAGSNSWSNVNIPNTSAPNNLLAMLWDDLSPQNGGSVRYYRDTANGRFIVSYTNVPFYSGGGNVNFEAILYPNGRVLFEYATVDGGTRGLNQCTVGIENSAGTDGLQVVYNANYLHNNMAILFNPPARWLSTSIHGGSLVGGADTLAVVTFDATNLSSGTYTGHLDLDSNDPDEGSIDIPLTFTVGGQGAPNIWQTPLSIMDTLVTGGSSVSYLKVMNIGSADLTVSFSDSAAWITEPAGPFIIHSSDSLLEAVTLNATGLAPSLYTSRVVTHSNDADQPTILLPVTLLVTSPPVPDISFHPSTVTDTLIEGGTTTRNLTISNRGNANLIVGLSAIENNVVAGGPSFSGKLREGILLGNSGEPQPPHILNTWLFIAPAADTIPPGDSLTAIIALDGRFIGAGEYSGQVNLASNDPDTPTAVVPVALAVRTAGSGCDYVPGDVNGSSNFDGIDVGMAVNFFKGAALPPAAVRCPPCTTLGLNMLYPEGDVNATCSFNGIDIGYMVNHFKYWGPPDYPYPTLYCPQCLPAGMNPPAPAVEPKRAPVLKAPVKTRAAGIE